MHKEIENYLIDNISEMEKEICLITEEYEDDISKFDDEEFYKDVIAKLRAELNSEVRKLTDKYEGIRAIEIEKIKTKYLK